MNDKDIIDIMRLRLLDVINPNVNYTQEDFTNEFNFSEPNDKFKLSLKFVNKSNNTNPGFYAVLQICQDANPNHCCTSHSYVKVGLPLNVPQWKEISPF